MASPPLSDDQLEQIREFFTSETAHALFRQIQDGLVADWINTQDTASRELIWLDLQAMLRLAVTLRDAQTTKRLSQRAQQAYQNTSTGV